MVIVILMYHSGVISLHCGIFGSKLLNIVKMSGITSVLTQEFLAWISRNRITFIIVVLLAGNVYQYMDRSAIEIQSSVAKQALNDQILKLSNEAVEYERRRNEKLEFLIQALKANSNESTNTYSDTRKSGH